ncbi:hypothetical protein LMH87_009492 [Akanthomyces muscarius]|uniref:Ankyrin repeat protein n=1 Tax=Akanthomyces muscarius TaxID=2231603 RepID=A0A9W8QD12_AKAMU|nr:hypothetical protein LMH87_009492 [Akanthomyces muscarius]KAJ4152977.1 hypothetical protein LMH87_009492 [Akanthomyces muscarius]
MVSDYKPCFGNRRTNCRQNVATLVKSETDVSGIDGPRGWTSLHTAASQGRDKTVKLLIESGADVKIATADGVTALHAAAASGSLPTMQLLLTAGANMSAINFDLETPLHVAIHFLHQSAARLLIDAGANVSAANAYGQTALHGAASRGLDDIARLLVDAGADINALDNNLETPVYCSIASESVRIFHMFLESGKVDYTPGGGPLLVRAAEGEGDFLLPLLHSGAQVSDISPGGETALHRGAAWGTAGGVQVLLDAGADPMAINDAWESPMHLARSEDVALLLLKTGIRISGLRDASKILLDAASRGWATFAPLFFEEGFVVSEANKQGETILHLAAAAGSESLTQWSLDAGANLSSVTIAHDTALHKAAMSGSVPVTRLLLTAGAEVSAANANGETPLHYATLAGSDAVARVLLEAAADVNARSVDDSTALHLASMRWSMGISSLLLEAGLLMNMHCNEAVPVDFETTYKTAAAIRRLISHGADVSATNSDGETPFHIALGSGIKQERNTLLPDAPLWRVSGAGEQFKAISQEFLDAGADLSVPTKDGDTVLHLAALGGWLEAMQLLIDAGAEVAATNSRGESVLHYAALSNSMAAAKLILDCGADASVKAEDGRTAREFLQAEGWDPELRALLSHELEL